MEEQFKSLRWMGLLSLILTAASMTSATGTDFAFKPNAIDEQTALRLLKALSANRPEGNKDSVLAQLFSGDRRFEHLSSAEVSLLKHEINEISKVAQKQSGGII